MRAPLLASAVALGLLAVCGFQGTHDSKSAPVPTPGEYYCRTGTENATLTLNRSGGYVGVARGCFHHDEERGTYHTVDGVLILRPEPSPERDHRLNLDRRLYPVRWGKFEYLVADKKMLAFCSQIAEGWKGTRTSRDDTPYYLLGAKQAPEAGPAASSLPDVPEIFRRYLRQPFEARVLSVWEAPAPSEASGPERGYLGRALVDKGAVDGVVVGTPLEHTAGELSVLRVIRVEARRAVCEVVPWGEPVTPNDKVVASRFFW